MQPAPAQQQQQPLHIVSLNVCYEPAIGADSPYHFSRRWPAIQSEIAGADVVLLQEVHEEFLRHVSDHAVAHGYAMVSGEYHSLRKMHLATLIRLRGPYRLISSAVHSVPGSFNKALSVLLGRGADTCSVYNVHFPLDIAGTGDRLTATRAILTTAAAGGPAIVLGDWNTLPPRDGRPRGDAAQLAIAEALGCVVPWDHGGAPAATYWGYPHEAEDLRGYGHGAVLDRLFVTAGLAVAEARCRHRFVEIDGVQMGISDHMPCHARVMF